MTAGSQVELTFFCELDAEAVEALFAEQGLPERLRILNARVSLGILDFSAERAAVVRRLNAAAVPVVAWQLLPMDKGYWYNLCNATEAAERYGAFLAWTQREGLRWAGIGVDIEPDIRELQHLVTNPFRFVAAALRRGCGKGRYRSARRAYENLVARMRSDGYIVYSYEFPFVDDEVKAGSTLLQRLFGVTAVEADQRVLLIYSSFFRPLGDAILWSYAQPGNALGIGLTGGGVQLGGVANPAPLRWEEFARDLAIASRWCRQVHVFSLEGCVHQGFLERLERQDWARNATPSIPWTLAVAVARRLLQLTLRVVARPWLVVALLGGGAALLVW